LNRVHARLNCVKTSAQLCANFTTQSKKSLEFRVQFRPHSSLCRCWHMAAHILHIAYYPNLQATQALLLKSAGYEVTSVLGNKNARALDAAVIAAADLIVLGFCAPHSVRTEMVLWFKAHYPKIRVIALKSNRWETFPEADVSSFSEDPNNLLTVVGKTLKTRVA
jgi:hypothetical protein